jgi:hypothetical protein
LTEVVSMLGRGAMLDNRQIPKSLEGMAVEGLITFERAVRDWVEEYVRLSQDSKEWAKIRLDHKSALQHLHGCLKRKLREITAAAEVLRRAS